MLAELWKVVIASAALATMMPNGIGYAKTVGAQAGVNTAFSTLPTDRSGLTPQCGRFSCEPWVSAERRNVASAMPDDVVFKAEDNGRVANVPVGRRFGIRLEDTATTGYKWSKPEFDSSCLRLGSDEYTPYK